MAGEEAKAMLDALMGSDRNAPLPKGAARPRKRHNKENDNDSNHQQTLLLPGKRHKSCYDKDIDPLYTAWGIDVYDLFINTKSDLGANPYIVDEGAHREFLQLPTHEQDRLGFHHALFQKLQELVRQCDRIVARNKEKLQQEIQRKFSQRGGQDFVEDVDPAAVDMLARSMLQVEELQQELDEQLLELDTIVQQEDTNKKQLEPLLEKQRAKQEAANATASEATGDSKAEQRDQQPEPKMEEDEQQSSDVGVNVEPGTTPEDADIPPSKIKVEPDEEATNELSSQAAEGGYSLEIKGEGGESIEETVEIDELGSKTLLEQLQMELGQLTLKRQKVLFELGRVITRLAPLQESVETQHRNLNYVKSDTSTDKTVCEVSGNFMSSRDADERIAAHYAGKQYVGWKLVRDKLQAMVKQYGRHGPPPPPRGGPDAGGPLVTGAAPPASRGGGSSGHYGGGGPGAGGFDRGGGSGRGRYDDRGGGGGGGNLYRGGVADRGGGPDRGGPDRGGRWERHGPPGDFQDRGRRGNNGPPPPRGDWRR